MNGLALCPFGGYQIYGAVVANHSSTRPPRGHHMNIDWSNWFEIVMGVIRLGLLWMLLRWLWLNYKASKIVIELHQWIQLEMEKEKEREEAENESEGVKETGETKTRVDLDTIFKRMKSSN